MEKRFVWSALLNEEKKNTPMNNRNPLSAFLLLPILAVYGDVCTIVYTWAFILQTVNFYAFRNFQKKKMNNGNSNINNCVDYYYLLLLNAIDQEIVNDSLNNENKHQRQRQNWQL